MKETFSNSVLILSYKFLSKSRAVSQYPAQNFLDQKVRKNVFLFQNTVSNPKTVPKAVFDPHMIYNTVFLMLHDFQRKLRKFWFYSQTLLRYKKIKYFHKFKVCEINRTKPFWGLVKRLSNVT